jgi:hypothetical protein
VQQTTSEALEVYGDASTAPRAPHAAADRWLSPSLVVCSALAWGCGSRAVSTLDDALPPQHIVVEPCARRVAEITALGVDVDLAARKPSATVKRFLVDLRIRNYAMGVWLVLGEENFPTRLNEAEVGSNGLWLFDGNARANARWLAPGSEITLERLKVSSSYSEFPVTLGDIQIDGLTPRRWVQQGGQVDRRSTDGETTVPAEFFVECTTWIDLPFTSPGNVRTPTSEG